MSPFQVSRLKTLGLMRVWYAVGYGRRIGWYGFPETATEKEVSNELDL